MAEKKKFIDIEVPLLRTSIEALGTHASLTNKTIKLDLSRKLRGKGLNVTFQIVLSEDKLVAIPKKMELMTSYVTKIIRKKVDYVEDSFNSTTKDGIEVIIKPLLITRKKVSRAVRNKLRVVAKENILEFIKTNNYLDITQVLFNSELQKTILPKLKKVYPLAFCDLRVFDAKNISSLDLTSIKIEDEDESEGIDEDKDETLELNDEEDENAGQE
jgi:ribosomal protein S3AE